MRAHRLATAAVLAAAPSLAQDFGLEVEAETLPDGRLNPSVQSIDFATGAVTTLLRGMPGCDGIRTTPWGTVVATEEDDGGGAYGIMDPLALVDVALTDRAAGAVSDPALVAKRTALPTMAWEGFAITPEGAVDTAPLEAAVPDAEGALAMTTTVSRFLEGGAEANPSDTLDVQPGTGILDVVEDHPNGDIWACLPDGADADRTSDGCIRAASVMDSSAEPTGLGFDALGTVAYVSVRHSEDAGLAPVDGYGADHLIRLTGFARPATN